MGRPGPALGDAMTRLAAEAAAEGGGGTGGGRDGPVFANLES